MLMPRRSFSSASAYKFGFNGKENDNEVKGLGNQIDYGNRICDPRLGRFTSVDPLQANYPELTPYQFASNTPIQGVDLDGREVYHYLLLRGDDGKPVLKYQGEQTRDFASWEWIDNKSPATNFGSANGDLIKTKTIRVWLYPSDNGPNILGEIGRNTATQDFGSFKELQDWQAAGFPQKPVDPAEVEAQRKAGEEMAQQATLLLMMMTLGSQIDIADGDVEGYGGPATLPGKNYKTSPSNNTNKQATAANGGNTEAAQANNSAKPTITSRGERISCKC
jgi:RHS repeat-associated protein